MSLDNESCGIEKMGQKTISSLIIITIFLSLSTVSGFYVNNITEKDDAVIHHSLAEFNADFYVKNGSNWVKEIEKPVETILHFNITLTGSSGAYLTLTAVLPEMLTYLNATPQPREIKDNEYGSKNIYWYDEQFNGSQNFYFTAQIALNETNNCLATAVMLLPFQSDNETVRITGFSDQPSPLIANAHGPYTANVSEEIQFNGSAQGGVQPYEYYWEFGDGTISTLRNPIHSYGEANNYTAVVTVTDAREVSAKNSTTVLIKKKTELDITKPHIRINSPKNGIYLFNELKIPFSIPFIIGPITVKIDAFDNESGIAYVLLHKDNSVVANRSTLPYLWDWKTMSFGKHAIKAEAFDMAGNVNTTRLTIWKFF